jgi:hypothetical protein
VVALLTYCWDIILFFVDVVNDRKAEVVFDLYLKFANDVVLDMLEVGDVERSCNSRRRSQKVPVGTKFPCRHPAEQSSAFASTALQLLYVSEYLSDSIECLVCGQ